MKIPKKTDVLIIGGGPAGSMAAAKLAQKNISVVLFEKEVFPRDKVGESLIPHFWKFMDEMEVADEIQNENFIKKAGGATMWDGELRAMSFAQYGHKRPGLHVERDRFDHILLMKARNTGASVFENTTVSKVIINDDVNTVEYYSDDPNNLDNIEAKFIIDASGQNSIIAKQEGLREFDKTFRFQAFYGYFDKSEYLNTNGELTSFENRIEDSPLSLVSGTGDWGWVWHLVLQEKVSVGALIPRSEIEKFKNGGKSIEDRFTTHIKNTPLTGDLLQKSTLVSDVFSVRDYAYKPKEFVLNNCFLAGDAAAFADPINSEGVTMSLYGGFLAAWAITGILKNSKRASFYKNMYAESLRNRMQLFQLLSYPIKRMPAHLLKSCRKIIKNQSHDETSLILAHLMVTRRSTDFIELMKELDIPVQNAWREIALPLHKQSFAYGKTV